MITFFIATWRGAFSALCSFQRQMNPPGVATDATVAAFISLGDKDLCGLLCHEKTRGFTSQCVYKRFPCPGDAPCFIPPPAPPPTPASALPCRGSIRIFKGSEQESQIRHVPRCYSLLPAGKYRLLLERTGCTSSGNSPNCATMLLGRAPDAGIRS